MTALGNTSKALYPLAIGALLLLLAIQAAAASADKASAGEATATSVTVEFAVDNVHKADLFHGARGADVFVSPRHPALAAHVHAVMRGLSVHVTPAPHLEAEGVRLHTDSGLLALVAVAPSDDAYMREAPDNDAGLFYQAAIDKKTQRELALEFVVNVTTGEVVSGADEARAALHIHNGGLSPLGTWRVMANPAHKQSTNLGLSAPGLGLTVHFRFALHCHLHNAPSLRADHTIAHRRKQNVAAAAASPAELQGHVQLQDAAAAGVPPIIQTYRSHNAATRTGNFDVVNLLKITPLNRFLDSHLYARIPGGLLHPNISEIPGLCHPVDPKNETSPFGCFFTTYTSSTFAFSSVKMKMGMTTGIMSFDIRLNLDAANTFLYWTEYYRVSDPDTQEPIDPTPIWSNSGRMLCNPRGTGVNKCDPAIQFSVTVGDVAGRVTGSATTALQIGLHIRPGSVLNGLACSDLQCYAINNAIEAAIVTMLNTNGFEFPLGSLYPSATDIIPVSFQLQQFGTDTLAVCIAAQGSPADVQKHGLLLDVDSGEAFFNGTQFDAALIVSSQFMMSLLNRAPGVKFVSQLQEIPVDLLKVDDAVPLSPTPQPKPYLLTNIADSNSPPTAQLMHTTRCVHDDGCTSHTKEWNILLPVGVALRLDYQGNGLKATVSNSLQQTYWEKDWDNWAHTCRALFDRTMTVSVNQNAAGAGDFPATFTYDTAADTFSAAISTPLTCTVTNAGSQGVEVTNVGSFGQWLTKGQRYDYQDLFNIMGSHMNMRVTATLDKVSVRVVKSLLYPYASQQYFVINATALYTPGDFFLFGTIPVNLVSPLLHAEERAFLGSFSCPAGQVTVNGVCQICPAGSVSTGSSCAMCEGNTFAASAGATACTACPSSTVPNSAHSACVCPAGMFSPAAGVACQTCPAGSILNAARTTCTPCSGSNEYADVAGLTRCLQCSADKEPTAAHTSCRCRAGRYGTPGSTAVCQMCDVGYITNADRSVCTACSGETQYTNDVGMTACQTCAAGMVATANHDNCVCPLGQYTSSGGACTACPAGYITDELRRTCTPCSGANQYTSSAGLTFCLTCGAGTVANSAHTACVSNVCNNLAGQDAFVSDPANVKNMLAPYLSLAAIGAVDPTVNLIAARGTASQGFVFMPGAAYVTINIRVPTRSRFARLRLQQPGNVDNDSWRIDVTDMDTKTKLTTFYPQERQAAMQEFVLPQPVCTSNIQLFLIAARVGNNMPIVVLSMAILSD